MITSPCVKVCVMLPDKDVCAGCFRTLEEIALWSQLSEPQRADVMALLPARRKEVEASSA